MVNIRYCEVCGVRVTESEIENGNAALIEDAAYCADHVPESYHAGTPSRLQGGGRKRIGKTAASAARAGHGKSLGGGVARHGETHRVSAGHAETADHDARRSILILAMAGLVVIIVILAITFTRPDRVTVPSDTSPSLFSPTNPSAKRSEPRATGRSRFAFSEKSGESESKFPDGLKRGTRNGLISPADRFGNDADGDGMPDMWETRYGLNDTDISDAGRDEDGDGFINLFEYIANTDPSNATSMPPTGYHIDPATPPKPATVTLRSGSVTAAGYFAPQNQVDANKGEYLSLSASPKRTRDPRRSFLKFRLSGMVGDCRAVTSATLRLYTTSQRDGDRERRFLIGPADRDLATFHLPKWDAMKDLDFADGVMETVPLPTSFKDHQADEIDVTSIVKYWLEGKHPVNGFLMRYVDESRWTFTKWYGPRFEDPAYRPTLTIQYMKTVRVKNVPPAISKPIAGDKPVTVKRGEPVSLSAAAMDPDGDGALTFSWDFFAGDGVRFNDAAGSAVMIPGYTAAGKYLAVVRVADDPGGIAMATIVIDVR